MFFFGKAFLILGLPMTWVVAEHQLTALIKSMSQQGGQAPNDDIG